MYWLFNDVNFIGVTLFYIYISILCSLVGCLWGMWGLVAWLPAKVPSGVVCYLGTEVLPLVLAP